MRLGWGYQLVSNLWSGCGCLLQSSKDQQSHKQNYPEGLHTFLTRQASLIVTTLLSHSVALTLLTQRMNLDGNSHNF